MKPVKQCLLLVCTLVFLASFLYVLAVKYLKNDTRLFIYIAPEPYNIENDKSTHAADNASNSTGSDSIDRSTGTSSPPTSHEKTSFPFADEGKTWSDEFCNDFLSNRFKVAMTPCGKDSSRVLCYGSPYDDKMGTCILTDLAIDVKKFYEKMRDDRDGVQTSNTMWLLRGDQPSVNLCPDPQFDPMEPLMAGGDYVKRLAKTSILSVPQGKCDKVVSGTTFLFLGFHTHIYFKYLGWYSLHNGILNYEEETGHKPTMIIRIPETNNVEYTFSEYEQKLFPEANVTSFKQLSTSNEGTMCFEKVIITPWAYSTNIFRCKMADAISRLRNRCYNCNSRGLTGTRFATFRRRSLEACGITDNDDSKNNRQKSIVLQIRKAYDRFDGDDAKKFERVLQNGKELVDALKKAFPSISVHTMYAEDLPICEQIRMVHDCDLFMGVHGAGLVHLWWLRDEAQTLELVPRSQMSNPTFKMLSALTGRQYHDYTGVKGDQYFVSVEVNDIISEVKKLNIF